MFLTSTSDIVRIVTATGVSTIEVQASWVDNASGTYTPGRTNTAITTATTTTVVASPASSTQRNVKGLIVSNNHATSSCVITIQHYDGTTSIDIEKITLAAGEKFTMAEDGEWRHLTVFGAEYEYGGPDYGWGYGIAGTKAESIPRNFCGEINTTTLTSGTLSAQIILLKAGTVVSNLSFFSATTAANLPTNQFFALYSRRNALLALSANDTTTAWNANTIKTLAMTTAYTVPVTDYYYACLLVTATAVPTLKGVTGGSGASAVIPVLRGNSTSGLTTVMPDPMTTPGGGSQSVWVAVT